MAKDFIIDSTAFKNPSTFRIEYFNITNMERLANGEMAGDLIAQKRKFYFTYDAIRADEFDSILNALWGSRKLFYLLKYPFNGTIQQAIVYVGSIPADLHRAGFNKDWVWKNLTFNLIEK